MVVVWDAQALLLGLGWLSQALGRMPSWFRSRLHSSVELLRNLQEALNGCNWCLDVSGARNMKGYLKEATVGLHVR